MDKAKGGRIKDGRQGWMEWGEVKGGKWRQQKQFKKERKSQADLEC